jgi:hypothetical protein
MTPYNAIQAKDTIGRQAGRTPEDFREAENNTVIQDTKKYQGRQAQDTRKH